MTLEHFDSIFAFVIVITGVSLIVTALNQTVSALLGLRGSNLRWGIQTLLSNLDPKLKEHAAEISERVLHHPLISDSVLSRFRIDPAVSGWTVTSVLAGIIAWLTRRWRLASAVRKDELVGILQLLANESAGGQTAKPSLATPAQTGTAGVSAAGTALPSSDPAAKDAWSLAQQALAKSLQQVDPQAAKDLQLVAADIRSLFPQDAAKADRLIAATKAQTAQLRGNIEQWFDSVMDRSSQRFALHMKIWTVIFSVAIAFVLQLDAFDLFKRVSSDAELRARLVASADGLTRKADDLLVATSNGVPATVYVDAMKQLIADHTNELAGLTNPPSGFTNLAGGQNWLQTELGRLQQPDTNGVWSKKYENYVPQAALRSASQNLHSLLDDQLRFDIIPANYPSPFEKDFLKDFLKNLRPKDPHALWGIVFSAALLSLGAPFWFNALKTMSNLRPLLANKQEQESKAAAE